MPPPRSYSLKTEPGRHLGHTKPVGVENVVVTAVAMNKSVLQRERIEPAGRTGVPGQLFHAHSEAAVRRTFLDHDHVGVSSQNLGKGTAIERLERMDRNNRRAFA